MARRWYETGGHTDSARPYVDTYVPLILDRHAASCILIPVALPKDDFSCCVGPIMVPPLGGRMLSLCSCMDGRNARQGTADLGH